jgi:hypothetical protein
MLVAAVLVGCGTGTRPAGDGTPWESLPPGWSSLAPPPVARSSGVSVWTGSELFHWGGNTDYDSSQHADGALYDPVADTWRGIPAGPLAGRSSAGATWIGTEVFVWGGWTPGSGWADGALFDPATGKWQLLPPAPLSPRSPVAVVWTGREVLVWGDSDRSDGPRHREGAAYDPASETWRLLPRAPLGLNEAQGLWTGQELVVFGALLDGNNWSDTNHAQGIAYDPEVNSWRRLPEYPLSPQASSVAWTGKEVLAWDYDMKAGAYDPARDSWRKLPDVPLRFYECYPDATRLGDVVLAWFCGQGAVFDVSTSSWHRVAPASAIYGRPVSAGEVVLFAGAAEDGSRNRLWAFKP